MRTDPPTCLSSTYRSYDCRSKWYLVTCRWTQPGKKCQGGCSFTYCLPLLTEPQLPQNELAQQLVYWKITVIMRIACCSELILKLYSPMDCAQERLVLERNKRALQVCTSFIEGSNDPLMKQDSLEESDVLCHF